MSIVEEVIISVHTEYPREPRLVLKATHGWGQLGLHDLWEYRELLYFLLWREVKGRYRQMAFGPLWIIVAPVIQMLVMSLVFGTFARLPSDGVPYPIFVYVALPPWQFFANSLRNSAGSLLSQQHLIAKVYFPRLIIPISTVLSALVDFGASLVVLALMMILFRQTPTWGVLTLPFFILLAGGLALGVGLWLAGLGVKFHDVAIAVGFGITIWQYLTPVAYTAGIVPDQILWLYQLNPMYSVTEGFRWALLGAANLPAWTVIWTTTVMLILLVTGAYTFRRTERTIVDVL
ncbi:MAG: ABC transporter permease [Caldilineaceae bacterium]|nr:ABC transporter permease [Caldilineaceae bacterium]